MTAPSSRTGATDRGVEADPYRWLVQASIADNGLPELSTEEFDLVLSYLRAALLAEQPGGGR